jgi:hypothetical protein
LTDKFWEEALIIRNKLLAYRLEYYGKHIVNLDYSDESLEPRLDQIIIPLKSMITDRELLDEITNLVREYNRQSIVDRGMSLEAIVLEALIRLKEARQDLSMKSIADKANEILQDQKAEDEEVYTLKPHGVGRIVRDKLKLNTEKTRVGIVAIPDEQKINSLCKKFGIGDETLEDIPF